MKVLIIAVVACLLLEAVLAVPAEHGGHGGGDGHGGGKAAWCQHKQDGKYPEPGSGCKKYYECKYKKYQGPYHCQGSYKFDDKEDKCMPHAQCY